MREQDFVQIGVIAMRDDNGEFLPSCALFSLQKLMDENGFANDSEQAIQGVASLLVQRINESESA